MGDYIHLFTQKCERCITITRYRWKWAKQIMLLYWIANIFNILHLLFSAFWTYCINNGLWWVLLWKCSILQKSWMFGTEVNWKSLHSIVLLRKVPSFCDNLRFWMLFDRFFLTYFTNYIALHINKQVVIMCFTYQPTIFDSCIFQLAQTPTSATPNSTSTTAPSSGVQSQTSTTNESHSVRNTPQNAVSRVVS